MKLELKTLPFFREDVDCGELPLLEELVERSEITNKYSRQLYNYVNTGRINK